jgi:hypothetical protein
MTLHKKNIAGGLLLYIVIGLVFSSCLKKSEIDLTTDQLFRPTLFTTAINGVRVDLSWSAIKNASYLLEVSRDSLKFEQDLQTYPINSVTNYLLSDLRSTTRYSARVKAVSKISGVEDSEYQEITFVTGQENIFFELSTADIFRDRIMLRWSPAKVVTHIKVLSGGQVMQTLPIIESEMISGERLVTGLVAGTKYEFRIYNGEEALRGIVIADTLP